MGAEHGASEVGNAFGSYECLCGHISYEACEFERIEQTEFGEDDDGDQ